MADVVVFTGTLTMQTRKEASAEAERHGYKVGSSLTKATTILVCGEKAGKKMEEAKKLNVKVVTEAEWKDMLGGEGGNDEEEQEEEEEEEQEEEPKAKKPTRKASKPVKKATAEGDVVVFTGTLTKQTRKEATAQAERCGYTVGGSVTNATTILVCGEKAGKKMEDAKKKGITVYTEDEWEAKLGDGAAEADEDLEDEDDGDEEEEEEEEEKPKKRRAAAKKADSASAGASVVVFTGTLSKQSRKEATAQAEAHGYTVGSSVTKATTILVSGGKAGKKADDAAAEGITVYTEEEWEEVLGASGETKPSTKKEKAKPAKKAPATATKAAGGEVVVFTGTLTLQTRKEAAAEAEKHGFCVGSSLTKATTYLVCGDKAGKKLEEAQKLNVQVFTEDEWKEKLQSNVAEDMDVDEEDEAADDDDENAEEDEDEGDAEDGDKPKDVVVFTGTLIKFSRKEATAQAESYGYIVGNSVTKATTILVCGDRAGKKRDDALKKGITVFTEEEWEARLADEKPVKSSKVTGGKRKAAGADQGASASKKTAVEDEPAELVYDEETGAINGVKPKTLIPDGQFHTVQSASGSSYLAKRLGMVYSCNCPAWRNQRHAPTSRTCKHLKEVLGEEFELIRAKSSATAPRAVSKASTKIGPTSAPKVLLANKWDRANHDPVNWWISEKLDGVRAFWDSGKQAFLSRNGNVYPAPSWFTEGFPTDHDLDGEIFGGRQKFQFTVGIAKTEGSKQWEQLVYKVFDVPSLQKPFEERMKHVQKIIDGVGTKYIEWVEHTQCKSLKHLDEVFAEIEKLGGEGLMIREPKSKYHAGRSSSLLKIKSFHDGEARVIAHENGKGKYTGMTGALRCQMASGKQFKVASGLSDADRENPPDVGTLIVYKCQELTNDGIPRFPVYVGIAADKTEPKDPVIANAAGRGD